MSAPSSENSEPGDGPMLPAPATGWRRVLLLVAAGVTFVLGIIGSILPAIPATPFLLITSYCLVRTSPRLHQRLLSSPWLGGILRDWQQHRAVRWHTKIQAMAVVCLWVGVTLYFSSLPLPLRITVVLLAAVGLTVIAHLRVVEEK